MMDKEFEKQLVRCFDVFGQALFLTIKASTQPAAGQVDAMRKQWRNLGKEVITLVKED